jgi:hypothetical protein
MSVSNKSYSKRRQSVRRDRSRRSLKGRPWVGKPSILENQTVHRRNKKAAWRTDPVSDGFSNLKNAATGWGADDHGGEWRSRFLEGGFFIAAGLSDVIKNGMDHLLCLVKGGREAVESVNIPPLGSILPDKNEPLYPDRVEPDLEPGYDEERNSEWLLNSEEIPVDEDLASQSELQQFSEEPLMPDSKELRESFEWSKMDSQDQEEFGLGDEELEDQAGALRSMFSNRNSE